MYFEKPGKQNTEKTLEVVKKAVKERGIKHVVVASCEGYTAKLFQQANLGVNLVCVTHVAGFKAPVKWKCPKMLGENLQTPVSRYLQLPTHFPVPNGASATSLAEHIPWKLWLIP